MSDVTPEKVRSFLLHKYADKIQGMGLEAAKIPDTFDFLLEGAVDSLGILDMVGALETEFNMELDMAALDAEQMTILGPLTKYVAEQSSQRSGSSAP